MKVLVISSKPPYPLYRGGGAIRTYQMIKSLSKFCEIDLLYVTNDDDVALINKGVEGFCHNVIPFRVKKCDYYWNVLKGLCRNKLPLQVNYFYFAKIQHWIDRHIGDYEAVFCNNIRTTEYVRNKRGVKKWVDFVDAISMNYEKAQKQVKGLWRWLYKIDHVRCRRYEQAVLRDFDKSIVISEVDKKYILKGGEQDKDICVIGNYVEMPESVISHQAGNFNIVFVGKMNYEPNMTAVKYFVDKVFPLVQENMPEVKFYIVGANPSPSVRQLSVRPGVIVTGFVDDVVDYMRQAAISIAPMRSGAGIQNKILQAMSLGGCVVTTTIGAEGLDVAWGGVVVKDSSQEMADEIIYLLKTPAKRQQIGARAIDYIRHYLVAEIVEHQVEDFLSRESGMVL